jgi:hypothetical protein
VARFQTVPHLRDNLPIEMLKLNGISTVEECDARMLKREQMLEAKNEIQM